MIRVQFMGAVRRPVPQAALDLEIAEDKTIQSLLIQLGYERDELPMLRVKLDGKPESLAASIGQAACVEIYTAFVVFDGG